MPFPNLPYYIDGDVKHSETMAIMRSICRKYKPEYLGRDLAEQAKVDALTNSLNDAFFAKVFGPCIFSQDWAANKAASGEADAKALLETIVSIKGSNKFLFGNEPTYGDFIIAGVCVVTQLWDASIVEAMPAIQEYIGTFLALENVAAYNEEDAAPMSEDGCESDLAPSSDSTLDSSLETSLEVATVAARFSS